VMCQLDLGTIPTVWYVFSLSILFHTTNWYITRTFLRLYDVHYLIWYTYSISTQSGTMFAVCPQNTLRYLYNFSMIVNFLGFIFSWNRESGRSWIYYICLLRVSILSLVTIFDRILKSFRQRGILGFSFYFMQQIDKYLVTFRGLYDVLYLLWLLYSISTPNSITFVVFPQNTVRYWC
jgi:hypothetical protein